MHPSKFFAVLFATLCFLTFNVFAQTPKWAYSTGGSWDDDFARVCKISPNGNLLVAGYFSGTADFDFSPAIYNLTSNGGKDCFIACYSSQGNFLWAFNIGGIDVDMIYDMFIDKNNNVLVAGSFRGQNVDFDPSGNSALLSEVGNTIGSSHPYAGEIFFAKYSPSGSHLWSMATGSSSVYEYGTAITADTAGYIYAAGRFSGIIDIDPSAGVYNLNPVGGKTCFLAKYTPSGQLIRGFNFGGSLDNFIRGLKTDDSGNVYITGYFQGLNVDFDPGQLTSLLLSANGGNDLYIAKYDSLFNVKFAHVMGGNGMDEALDLELDNNNDIYISGYVSGSVNLDPANPLSIINTSGSGFDIFLAKYTSNGQFAWGKIMGNTASDIGVEIDVRGNILYCTGGFRNTVDFDPPLSIQTLTSNGLSDVYLAKYTLNGSYLCGFKIGSASDDEGQGIAVDDSGYVYVAGGFRGSNVDFDPTQSTVFNLSSNGMSDLFMAKYSWICETSPLRIKLENLYALNFGPKNLVKWKTSDQSIRGSFILERSIDGKNFSYLSTIRIDNENNSLYSFWDETALIGINYYRLKILDASGQFEYSQIVPAVVKSDVVSLQIFPNPTKDICEVKINKPTDINSAIILCDVTGKLIKEIKVVNGSSLIDMTGMMAGIYLIKYINNMYCHTVKLEKL